MMKKTQLLILGVHPSAYATDLIKIYTLMQYKQ